MSKNKIRHTEHASKSIPVIKPLIVVILMGGIIWGLFSLFQPAGDLVPYNKYKKTEVSVAVPEDTGPKSQSKPPSPPAKEPESFENRGFTVPARQPGFASGEQSVSHSEQFLA